MHEVARDKFLVDAPEAAQRDPGTGERRDLLAVPIVHHDPAGGSPGIEEAAAPIGSKQPSLGLIPERDHLMAMQVSRHGRGAMLGKVAGCGAENARVVREASAPQAGVDHLAGAQRQIEAAFQDVELGVRQAEVEVDAGVLGQEHRQQGHDVELREGAGGGEAQGAGRRDLSLAERRPRGFLLGEDLPRVGQELRPLHRERDLAGRAVQQVGAQCLLELREPGACDGRRQAELTAGGGDVELFRRQDEEADAVRVHVFISKNQILNEQLQHLYPYRKR